MVATRPLPPAKDNDEITLDFFACLRELDKKPDHSGCKTLGALSKFVR